MVAALGGRLDIVKKLRARGAEVDGPGWNALIYAATGGHDEVVRYLLAEGADSQCGVAQRHDGADDGRARGQGARRSICSSRAAPTSIIATRPARARSTWARRTNEKAMVERLQRAGAR